MLQLKEILAWKQEVEFDFIIELQQLEQEQAACFAAVIVIVEVPQELVK